MVVADEPKQVLHAVRWLILLLAMKVLSMRYIKTGAYNSHLYDGDILCSRRADIGRPLYVTVGFLAIV